MEKTSRNSNHELLRLVAMYMIVLIHANMYLSRFCTGSTFRVCNGIVNGICNIGVSCFILISGYYGVRFTIGKFVKMECMMITYSLLETVMLYFMMPEQLEGAALLEQLAKSCLPFITRKYWFYSCYVCLMFFSGYLQKMIEYLKKEEFQKLLLLMLVLFSLFPTLFYFELIPDNGKGLVQMIMVYLMGRYIRLYRDVKFPKKAWLLFIALWIANGISHELPIQIGGNYHHLCKDNSITNLAMAVILFYMFKEIKIQSSFINKAAGYVFAVFALNNSFVAIAMDKLKVYGIQSPGGVWGFLMLLAVVFAILVLCLLIGAFRELLLGRVDGKISQMVSSRFNSKK